MIRGLLGLLRNKEISKYGSDVVFVAKGKYELVDTWKEKWEKVILSSRMYIEQMRYEKQKKRNDRKIKKMNKNKK